MKIEISDLPNQKAIKHLNIIIEFDNIDTPNIKIGNTSFESTIEHVETPVVKIRNPDEIPPINAEIPDEMKDISF